MLMLTLLFKLLALHTAPVAKDEHAFFTKHFPVAQVPEPPACVMRPRLLIHAVFRQAATQPRVVYSTAFSLVLTQA